MNSLIKLIRGKGAILNYHRVLPLNKIDNYLVNISVSENNFINQINYLKNNYDIISMDDLLLHLKSKSNEFKIVITFDDGYKDNLNFAFPILEKFKAPATFYVITKFIDNKFIPWWFIIDKFIRNRNFLGNRKMQFNDFKKKILFGNQLIIDQYVSLFAKNQKRLKYGTLFFERKDLKYLSQQKLITIGSHSHSHYNFSQLKDDEAYNEFKISKSILEQIIKKRIVHFSYPYGGYENINFKHNKFLQQLGFLSAVTTINNKIDNSNFFSLPRIFVNNDNNLFRLKLKLFGFKKFY